jgi:recombination protein RecA
MAVEYGRGLVGHEQRLALVDALARELEAKFGPGILYRLARARPKVGAVALSTGSVRLDGATRLGGVPRGRLTLLRGGASSGKTTLAYHLLAEAQRGGGLAALIDGEGAADLDAMQACGVDTSDLILASPDDAREALEMVEILVRCQALDAVVATELPPTRAGLLALGLRRLSVWLKDAPTAVVVVADLDEPRPGWRRSRAPLPAVPHAASLIVELRQLRPLFGPGGEVRGLRVRAEVVKNRQAPLSPPVELEVTIGRGLRRAAEALELGLEQGLLNRTPQGVVWDDLALVLGRGPDAALTTLEREPELVGRLLDACLRLA